MISFQELLTLDNFDIDIYPNKISEDNYNLFKSLLENNHIKADRINLLPQGGVCFIFKKQGMNIYFEIYNDGESGYIIENPLSRKVIANEYIDNFQNFIRILKKFYL